MVARTWRRSCPARSLRAATPASSSAAPNAVSTTPSSETVVPAMSRTARSTARSGWGRRSRAGLLIRFSRGRWRSLLETREFGGGLGDGGTEGHATATWAGDQPDAVVALATVDDHVRVQGLGVDPGPAVGDRRHRPPEQRRHDLGPVGVRRLL